jgi:hypothetical protein
VFAGKVSARPKAGQEFRGVGIVGQGTGAYFPIGGFGRISVDFNEQTGLADGSFFVP